MSHLDDELAQAVKDAEAEAEAVAQEPGPVVAPATPSPSGSRRNWWLLGGLLVMGGGILTLVMTSFDDAAVYEPPRNQLVQLAVDGPRLAGFVCAYGAHDPAWGSLIDNLHVASDFKRHGIGAELMRRAGAWLDQEYPELEVHLLVLEMNAAARRFYERLGGRNAETSTTETHGGAVVRSCRYVWPRPSLLRGPARV